MKGTQTAEARWKIKNPKEEERKKAKNENKQHLKLLTRVE
jgi:hypothetical protein